MEFFEKYRLQNVGATRARLAELITIFENERQELTIRELHDLRDETGPALDRETARRGVLQLRTATHNGTRFAPTIAQSQWLARSARWKDDAESSSRPMTPAEPRPSLAA